MKNWMKVMFIPICVGSLLGACSNSPEQAEVTQSVEVEAPIVTENLTNDFSQTLGYTLQPPPVDPETGYFVGEIADGIYWLSGFRYQTLFFTTGEGVIVIDAPQPMGASYLEAIQSVTDEPITHMIYSHAHSDHVGAAGMFPPDMEYIAHQDTADILSGVPAATITFEDTYTLAIGSQVLELSYIGTFHSAGDIVIYAPRQKVAMVVDLFHPGSAPFAGFGVTVDLGAHLQAHDILIEEYDFNVLIPGHTEILATKSHLETNRAFVLSMQEIVKDAIESLASDEVLQTCIDMTIAQWEGVLDNLEDRVAPNCQKMEAYLLSQ
ncbi:MAG: MBL fold metallo-hydrolase [Anaerolineae bacterium]|nr:MBL fold metallo-hydrolase [Anaerolineae bacterium]